MKPDNIPKFVALQLQLIREVIARIDLGGTPTGKIVEWVCVRYHAILGKERRRKEHAA
jgi:hypothetical protein